VLTVSGSHVDIIIPYSTVFHWWVRVRYSFRFTCKLTLLVLIWRVSGAWNHAVLLAIQYVLLRWSVKTSMMSCRTSVDSDGRWAVRSLTLNCWWDDPVYLSIVGMESHLTAVESLSLCALTCHQSVDSSPSRSLTVILLAITWPHSTCQLSIARSILAYQIASNQLSYTIHLQSVQFLRRLPQCTLGLVRVVVSVSRRTCTNVSSRSRAFTSRVHPWA